MHENIRILIYAQMCTDMCVRTFTIAIEILQRYVDSHNVHTFIPHLTALLIISSLSSLFRSLLLFLSVIENSEDCDADTDTPTDVSRH